ncbi:hypothetical protein D7D52_06780 [Nocardia yunnanensis]|uniref:Mce-associated membrane protein n=1 Tax=Nocardia yunnanensis TaxID=2382165 RepID=A0A386ZAH2_9NOCA|nr:hypothetical protein [Nocardia yunnanensis]AYF73605.1 hypothetical protein D7D52_06780 [Nocardia yunnanensis]
MSQLKDSDSGDNLEKPTETSVPDTTPDASSADAGTPQRESGTETAESAATAEPTVVLDKPAAGDPPVAAPPAAPAAGLDARRAATVGAAVLLVAAAVAAVVVGFLWFGDHKDETRAQARDAALTDARQAATNLMSINPDDIDGSLANIRSSMTGELLKQQEDGQDQLKQTAQDSKTRITADVEGITLTSLDSELDHASAFAVLKITRSWPGGQPATFRQLWTLDMLKVGSTWKAEKAQNLGEPVPLGAATPQGGQQPAATPTPAPGN